MKEQGLSNRLRPVRLRFISAVIGSGSLILVSALQMSIVDRITPFGIIFLNQLIWLIFLGTLIASLTCLFKFKDIRAYSLAPLSINLLSLAVVVFVPLSYLWLKADFALYRSERERVVSEVAKGVLQPNVEHNDKLIALSKDYPLLSMAGNEIVVEKHDGQTYILFFAFRGILDNYSGFLHVPAGGDPTKFSDLNEEEASHIERLDDRWYFVSHR